MSAPGELRAVMAEASANLKGLSVILGLIMDDAEKNAKPDVINALFGAMRLCDAVKDDLARAEVAL